LRIKENHSIFSVSSRQRVLNRSTLLSTTVVIGLTASKPHLVFSFLTSRTEVSCAPMKGMWWGCAIEAPDPFALATFYSELLDWPIGHREPRTENRHSRCPEGSI
jgi:hypothetical protein